MFVDERTASGIDEDGGGFHQGEAVGVDQFTGTVVQWAVQADDVTFVEQLVEFRFTDFGRKLEARFGSVGPYLHTEADGYTSGVVAGLSQSYDTDFFSEQLDEWSVVEAEVGILTPVSLADFFGIMAYLLGDVQDMCKYHLSDRGSAVCRDIGDDDAAFTGGVDVYHVVACSHHADVFQIGQGSHCLAVDHYLIGKDGFCTGSTFKNFAGSGAIIDRALA